jgi:hypothetical protein
MENNDNEMRFTQTKMILIHFFEWCKKSFKTKYIERDKIEENFTQGTIRNIF